ncbi:hypothetical protein [Pseudarthrobacter raffinosi]|uniref:hypothetical protein n=1 Tax=Pseudarthrobacter raffinosi TaxID=2953651 RepID=UPI00208F07B6|nr:hypothetical protein [Pseudarthrobacter sp. MDT3-28]MCO4239579.1 hypothetical protein [Pseudarthrobacter sp. MDT3-28]
MANQTDFVASPATDEVETFLDKHGFADYAEWHWTFVLELSKERPEGIDATLTVSGGEI